MSAQLSVVRHQDVALYRFSLTECYAVLRQYTTEVDDIVQSALETFGVTFRDYQALPPDQLLRERGLTEEAVQDAYQDLMRIISRTLPWTGRSNDPTDTVLRGQLEHEMLTVRECQPQFDPLQLAARELETDQDAWYPERFRRMVGVA